MQINNFNRIFVTWHKFVISFAFHQVVKQLWAYIREHNLQDPTNRRKILCDANLQELFKVKVIDMFQMNKVLSKHIWPLSSDGRMFFVLNNLPTNFFFSRRRPKNLMGHSLYFLLLLLFLPLFFLVKKFNLVVLSLSLYIYTHVQAHNDSSNDFFKELPSNFRYTAAADPKESGEKEKRPRKDKGEKE